MKRLTAEEIQALYDIILTIKSELDLGSMLGEFLNVFLRKLNCNAGAVYTFHASGLATKSGYSRLHAIPRNPERSEDFREIIEFLEQEPVNSEILRKQRIIIYETRTGAHGYIAPVQKYGFIVFTKHGLALDEHLLYSLGSVFDRLGIACKACEHAAEIEQSRKKIMQVNTLLSERTVELEQSRESLIYLMRQMKRKELELMDSEYKYRTLFENIQDVFYRTDISGIVTDVTPSIFRFSGYTIEEIIGRPAAEFYVDLNQREQVRAAVEQHGEVFDFEILLRRKDGTAVPTSLNAHILKTHDGIPIGLEGSLRDITSRKKAEQDLLDAMTRLKDLIEHLQGGILVEDEHRTIVLANQTFCEMFAIDAPAAQLKGADCSRSAEQAMHLFADPEAFVDRINALLQRKEIATNEILKLADGRVFERDYLPVFVGSMYKGHMWHYRDITDRTTAEERIRTLNRQLEDANDLLKTERDKESTRATSLEEINRRLEEVDKLKTEFISSVSHELRTPLASILGFAETLQRDPNLDGDTRMEFLQIIRNEGTRLRALISDLLDISHLESGTMKLQKSNEDLAALITYSVKLVSPLAAEKSLRIVEPAGQLPVNTICDPTRITQAIVNILSNAIRFSPDQSEIHISMREEQLHALIEIEDQGPGIPDDERSKVFERFYRLKKNRDDAGGTGLGLAIVWHIMELHHGSVSIGGEEGKGAIFTLYIPRNDNE